ncbi:MAG: 1-aminocyclopropane-1-carboxylate deaminase/D-cysteine desulfhydrase [Sporocytophaga sp.]|uniref:1-aminocyclopropane-1-carboxylate deaminase/D-cysteine desulfhydrase n=1 Tax=Sporocytophaga sp. TaxID=2231183 RepID=UPI001B1EC6C5|nr:pyridoxal-phosphate dependent enzyme [Sporocytophaga sp.]MBO9698790.1 1-aminocyclopropane-1-carboxylate deaminase/D-cysteine desulfhydrase [Sporocytophaga sp.]
MNPKPFLQEINHPLCQEKNVRFFIWREDLNHPFISGNKFWKLKYNLERAKELGKSCLLTFGGAHSNHIYAFAAAGKEFGFETIGVIRGDECRELSPTLKFATECGMKIHQVSREQYRNKTEASFLSELAEKFGNLFIIPEGGSNEFAVKGCSEMIENLGFTPDFLCSPVGTGGTLAGIIKGMKGKSKILGFSALKGGSFLKKDIENLLGDEIFTNWEIIDQYHFGGYAKCTEELASFIKEFRSQFNVPLEPIYTAKMVWGILDLLRKDFFPANTELVVVHTGGLQGLKGFEEKGFTFS